METTISEFYTSFYITSIQNLAFHLLHVRILDTNHCGKMQSTALKRCDLFQDFLCCRDYAERVVARLDNQIQSEYYGGYISVSIEDILFVLFSALPQKNLNLTTS